MSRVTGNPSSALRAPSPQGEKRDSQFGFGDMSSARRMRPRSAAAVQTASSPLGEKCRAKRGDEGFPVMNDKTDAWIRKSGATDRARRLRQNETEAEYRFWNEVRNRNLNGHKFTRQIPLGPYVADFICREKNLIVELDGSQHAESEHDVRRADWLNTQGYSVLRFWNDEILRERRAVLETILAVLDGRIFTPCATIRFSPAHVIAISRNEGTEP
jgi:very-short-patch-repair endonuclease